MVTLKTEGEEDVKQVHLQNFVTMATDITGKEDFLLFSSKVDCI